ncbi:putative acyltransferase [Aequorivita sublithincola DSM 14238]|uniref:Putative acyltransferase n=1 Tax=Aequorivita sublithincola (strain DSM 14238 / LMG 21431 / ACAM 643 / 9-3) TaxID=746697 RepID=I3YZH5_AEQSU|nr:acyltransferase [Aequorivita sublithincola]AFL82393.1 putative acyltransferase [Aequorivita sublithincola DSM 14238]
MNRLPNLDPLRFFLASIVLLFHLPQLSANQGLPYFDGLPIFHRGLEAVYMFFVLSGFLIIRLIYRAKLKGTFSIKDFYIRRILRIFPLYYLVLGFGLVFYNVILPFLNIPFEINYTWKEAFLYNVFFLPNVFAKIYEPGGIIEILWSIGIEEQFYLVIAPLLFLINVKWILRVLSLLLLGYFILYWSDVFEILRKYTFVFFYLFSGGVIAILEERKMLEFLKRSWFFPFIICVATLLYFVTDWFLLEAMWLRSLLTCSLFGFFIHSLAFNNRGVEVNSKILNHLGSISYGIYMFHAIVLNAVVFLFLKLEFLQNLNDNLTIILMLLLTFAGTLLIAHLSYTYFELYFLKLKNRFRK